jgi:hypothetical protein
MSDVLIRKELREHGWVIALALLLGALGLLGMLEQSKQTGGRFIALVGHARSFGLLFAAVLANRLFAREYSGQTQLFLEILPLGRARVFWTKWLLGLGVVAMVTVAAWYGNLRWIRRSEVLDWHGALAVLGCVTLFNVAGWAYAAMAGMLGRYRYLAWLAGPLLIYAVHEAAGIPIDELPGFRLLGEDVAMARPQVGALALVQAGSLVVLCAAAAMLLATAGSGAIASTLARRMTTRERVFILSASMTGLALITALESKPEPPPFELTEGEIVADGHARVAVMPTGDLDAASASQLARTISRDAHTLIERLGVSAQPRVFVLPQQGLDRTVMQRAVLSGAQGIVLRVAPDAPRPQLRALVLHSLIGDVTLQRAVKEDRHVLLDGLSAYWAVRDDPAARERLWLRAAAGAAPLSAERLQRWDETAEQLGSCLADASAFAVFATLEKSLGQSALTALLRGLFSPPHDDVRVLFEPSVAQRLQRAGLPWSRLAALSERARLAARARNAAVLALRPRYQASIAASATRDRGRTVAIALTGSRQYVALYRVLLPWTPGVEGMSRFDVRTARAVLPLSPARGSRVLVALEVEDAALDCPVRVLARRVDVP